MEINGGHIARWDHRLELLTQGAPIDVVGAPTTPDYMPWFLSITRRWMTPRALLEAAHYAPVYFKHLYIWIDYVHIYIF